MSALAGASAQDITAIASSGVMGISVLIIIGLLLAGKTPSTGSLWVTIVVITLACIVQLASKYMDLHAHSQSNVSVTFTPDPSGIAQFLPADAGAPIKARPRLWLEDGAAKCNPNSGASYDPKAADCLVFAQAFPITTTQEAIHVSVDDVMAELRDRVIKLSSINAAVIGSQITPPATTPSSRSSPIGENASPE